MILIRPCRDSDAEGIAAVVAQNSSRVSSLPRERDKLEELLARSVSAFNGDDDRAGKGRFLFVMEDAATGEILGTAGVSVNQDRRRPFYSYRRDELIHSSPKLGVHTAVPVLYLTHELTGTTVLSSFSIRQDYRQSDYFDLLVRSRLLFVRAFRERFSAQIATEIQGVHGEGDVSAFWESLGRHFFDMDFATADYYSSVKSRTFIAEMMPQHPIYVPLLTPEAQAVLGQADPRTARTCDLLEKEGFAVSKYVDIFDGGPTYVADIDRLQTVANVQRKRARCGEVHTGPRCLLANDRFADFRCVITHVNDSGGDSVRIDAQVAEAIGIGDGDRMSFVAL